MNIGIVTTWFERGAGMVSRAYHEVLDPEHKVFIYARGGEEYAIGDPNWDLDYVTWGKRRKRLTAMDWSDFRNWALRNKIDMILFNEQRDYSSVVFARRELDIPIGAYVDYYTSKTIPCFDLYDFLICNTRRHHSVFQHHPQALHIPWGTDCQLFNGPCKPVSDKEIVFFHSFGLSPERKGTDLALRAFHMMKGPCRFVLHAQIPLHNFPELAKLCAMDNRIKVIEKKVHAPGLYHLGDVYVYPTLLEGIGLTIAEALACGLPTIVPNVPPMNEFVQTGRNGRLVEPAEYHGRYDGYYWAECICTPSAIAEAMQHYIDNREQMPAFKTQARQSALESFDWKKNAQQLSGQLAQIRSQWHGHKSLKALEEYALEMTALTPAYFLARAALRRMKLLKYRPILHLIYG